MKQDTHTHIAYATGIEGYFQRIYTNRPMKTYDQLQAEYEYDAKLAELDKLIAENNAKLAEQHRLMSEAIADAQTAIAKAIEKLSK